MPATAYAAAGAMLARSSRLPAIWLYPILVAGNALVSCLVYFSAHPASFYALFYVWLNVYAFYFFDRRLAWAHTALALTTYGALELTQSGHVPFTQWLVIAGTLICVGAMVGSLKDRVTRLVADLDATAKQDPLTGLLNRRGFHELLEKEFERARRHERSLSVVVADLDHFKRVNDSLGHEAGDDVLRRLSRVFDSGHRGADEVARMGGEEFALIAPDTNAREALVLAERLRKEVAAEFADDRHQITMSCGIATFPAHAAQPGELVCAADEAMYVAKRLGRDRCELYESSPVEHPQPIG